MSRRSTAAARMGLARDEATHESPPADGRSLRRDVLYCGMVVGSNRAALAETVDQKQWRHPVVLGAINFWRLALCEEQFESLTRQFAAQPSPEFEGIQMLVKEKTSPPPADKFGRAGYEAEKQMAFYLRRAFAEDADVLVFNDLRLERNGETAQMDHLIVHRFGFVIVESKSVVGKLVVNARGEFMRIWNGMPRGIQSPIRQARLQAELLTQLLNDHKEKLRRKVFFGLKQGDFREERFQVFVAVSDSGVIKREGGDPPELLKADSVVDAIRNTIKTHAEASGFGGFMRVITSKNEKAKQIADEHLLAFTDDEMSPIRQFLLERHTPVHPLPAAVPDSPADRTDEEGARSTAIAETAASVAMAPANVATCKHCSGGNLAVVYGRYGYYFKCHDCQGTTPIDQTCSECGQKARISKSGLEFRRVCKSCGKEIHFHTNTKLDGTVK